MREKDEKKKPGLLSSMPSELRSSHSAPEKQKILIVDDKKENLVALRQVLDGFDAEIIEATSGNEALYATLDQNFAVAIVDVMMPEMDGYELAEYLRGDPKTRNIPIIFLTAVYSAEERVFKGYEVGAVDYIVKPYNPDVLRSKVRVFLELARTHGELAEKVSALTASEERFRSLVTTIPDIVYRIGTDGRFTYLNDAIQSLGYTQEDLLGSHFSRIVLPADVDNVSRELVLHRHQGKRTGQEGAPKLFDERRTGKRKTRGLEVRLVPRRGDKTVPAELHSGGPEIVIAEINSSGVYAGTPDGEKTVFLGTVGVIRDITERKEAEKELAKHRDHLEKLVSERVKEVRCLYAISSLIGAPFESLDDVLNKVVNQIPPGFQYSEIACARITVEGREFVTSNFRETQWRLSAAIPVPHSDSRVGNLVQVCYLEEKGAEHEGPFLKEERDLLDDIARQLGMMLQREDSIHNLRRIEWLLSKRTDVYNGSGDQEEDYLPPYGDLLALNTSRLILDSVGKEVLTDIVNDYLDLLDTSAAVYEKNGDYALGIFSSGWCRFMDAASRALCRTDDNGEALACGRWHCHESCWNDAAKAAIETGAPADIECKGGIRLYALPVFAGNEIIGAINFGYGDPPQDETKLRELATAFEVNIEELRALAQAYPPRPPYIIDLAKRRLASSARMIGEMVQRKKAEEREKHLKSLLQAIRDVNKLIEKEKRRDVLIQNACNTLVCSRGLQSAWIAVTKASPDRVEFAQAGLDEASFEDFVRAFRAGERPLCCRRGREKSRVTTILEPQRSCGSCPLAGSYGGCAALTVGLFYENQHYGYLGVSAPREFADDKDEVSLIEEVAGDIAFALHDIDVENDRAGFQAALKKSEQTLEAMFNNARDGILLADTETRQFVRANTTISRMLGYSPEEMTGLSVDDIHPAEDLPRVAAAFEQQIRGEITLAQDIPVKRKDGSTFPADVSAAPFELEGRSHLLGIFRDVTEQKKLEEQLIHAQKMEAIGTLAGGIAHDFNNILTSIIGYTELALGAVEKGTLLHDNLSEVLSAGRRATDLVKQILTISRDKEKEVKPVYIIPLIKEALKMLRSAIPASIGFRENICKEQLVVQADPTQIHQVIVNLATNAMQAMTEGEGILEIRVEPVSIEKRIKDRYVDVTPGDYAMITVSDTGIGIPEKHLDKIFEPYFTTKKKDEGTGLGLSVVHGVVKAHKGHITVHSEPGKGSTFYVYLPLAEHLLEDLRDGPVEPLPTGTEHILLVDDEPSIVKIQQQILEGLGYRITASTSSVEALEAFRSSPDRFDLVITDMTMPEMTGDKLAVELMKVRPDIAVILCTGYSKRVSDDIAKEGGIKAFVYKPIMKADLAKTVREVLDAGRRGA